MLEPRDIIHLKLTAARLAAHRGMPAPRYVKSPLIGQYAAISDAVISELLGVPVDIFQAQLDEARRLGTAYVHVDPVTGKRTGFMGSTSLIKGGPVINKNLIVPMNNVLHSPEMHDHIIVGAFVRGHIADGMLTGVDDIEIAGWARASEVLKWKDQQAPFNFKTSLNCLAMPCNALNPIDTLPRITVH